MGNSLEIPQQDSAEISINSFQINFEISKSLISRILHVTHLENSKDFSLKETNKLKIVSKKCISPMLNERKILAILNHHFIENLQYAFQS